MSYIVERTKAIVSRVNQIVWLVIMFLAITTLVVTFSISMFERVYRDVVGQILQTVLDGNHKTFDLWLDSKKSNVRDLALYPRTVEITQQLLTISSESESLQAYQHEVRDFIEIILNQSNALNYFIIAPDGSNLSALHDRTIGMPNVITQYYPRLLQDVFWGDTVIVPPTPSTMTIIDRQGHLIENMPTVLSVSPILNEEGHVIAALAIGLNIIEDFSSTSANDDGLLGETYIFDAQGLLLSETRYQEYLQQAGFLDPQRSAINSIRIVDPGGDLRTNFRPSEPYNSLPLTIMAQNAVDGLSGVNMNTYRNYVGIPVVGAWAWNAELGIGIVTESEEYYVIRVVRIVTIVVIVLAPIITGLSVALVGFLIHNRRQQVKFLHELTVQLEQRVEARTEELRQNKRRFEDILGLAGDGIISVDKNHNIVLFNHSAERTFDYLASEVHNQPLDMLLSPRHAASIKQLLQIVHDQNGEQTTRDNFEVYLQRKGHVEFPAEISISKSGRADWPIFTLIVRDIGARKEADEALQKSEERLQLALGASQIGTWHYDMYSNSIVMDQRTAQIFGHPGKDDIEFDSLFTRVHPSDVQRMKEAFTTTLVEGIDYDIDYRIMQSDGSIHQVISKGALVQDSLGNPDRFYGICIDVTERKLIERKLQSIYDMSIDMIGTMNFDGYFIDLNPAWEKALDWSVEELKAKPFSKFIHRDDLESTTQEYLQVIRGGATFSFENRFLHRNGSYRWLSWNAVGSVDERLVYFTVRDITSRKQTEKKLQEAQSMLIHSEKMSALGQLVAGIAHEINNPIAFVNSNLYTIAGNFASVVAANSQLEELLAEHEVVQELKMIKEELDLEFIIEDSTELVAETVGGLQRITDIIAALRVFSHLGEAESKEINLSDNIHNTLTIARGHLKGRVDVVADIENLPIIHCYPAELNQVFLNLIINAAQAIEEYGTITITGHEVEDQVIIQFTDTGGGMTTETLNHIFDPFFTTKPIGQGTGLGLSVAYKIITEQHGGKIEVQSELGQGSTFTINLPKKLAEGTGVVS